MMKTAQRWLLRRIMVRGLSAGLLLSLPACCIPGLRPAESTSATPSEYQVPAGPVVTSETSATATIQEFYSDPLLTGYIEQALAENRELKAINEEIEIARAEILTRRGAFLPAVGFNARATLDKPSLYSPRGAVEDQLEYLPGKGFPDPLPEFLGSLDFIMPLDIWREYRNARDAARQRYQAAIERRSDFVTRLVADVAETYYRLLALDQRLETLNQTIKLQEQSLEVAKARKEAGRGTELAVQRFVAEVRKNQSEKLIVQQDIIESENRINLLTNRFAGPVNRATPVFLDLDIPGLKVGLPAQLLQYRPDIRQAEFELAAAGLDVKVARARFYPRLDITAGVGLQALNTRYLFLTPESLIYGVAGNLTAPLINRAAIKADYFSANARQLQAIYNYQRIVLNAYIEVVNRVSMAENYRKSIDVKKQQLQALLESVETATKLFQNARVEYVEVLLAQRDMMDARLELIDTKREQLTAVVKAYQALGGGMIQASTQTKSTPTVVK